jgi:hypothetical protein
MVKMNRRTLMEWRRKEETKKGKLQKRIEHRISTWDGCKRDAARDWHWTQYPSTSFKWWAWMELEKTTCWSGAMECMAEENGGFWYCETWIPKVMVAAMAKCSQIKLIGDTLTIAEATQACFLWGAVVHCVSWTQTLPLFLLQRLAPALVWEIWWLHVKVSVAGSQNPSWEVLCAPLYCSIILEFSDSGLHLQDTSRGGAQEGIGSLAHYKESVNAWPHDTSKEAEQQHYELTGEDEPEQLLNMMHYETHGGYKHMMGSDICIHWVPLTMLQVKKKSNKVIFPLQLVPLCFSWQVRCNSFSLSKLTIHIVHFMSICDQRIKPVVVQLIKETIKKLM